MSWLRPEVMAVLVVYALLIAFFLAGRRRLYSKNNSDQKLTFDTNWIDEISVVIPFRNEETNLLNLLKNIKKLNKQPLEFILVNDHSSDQSLQVLGELKLDEYFSIVSLPVDKFGKKEAIAFAVQEAKGKYILTWDADISMNSNYFDELATVQPSDLLILPVEMKGTNWVSGFFAWDYQLQTQTSQSMAGWGRILTASGANLLCHRAAFLSVQDLRTDGNWMSGDDQFLLKTFRMCGKSSRVVSNSPLTVLTEAPKTICAGLSQRARWLSKSATVDDKFANLFGWTVFLIQMGFYTFVFYQLALGFYGSTILLILIKGELDAFLCTYKYQQQFSTIQVFLYELFFPVYIVTLIFITFLGTNRWKGRALKKPF